MKKNFSKKEVALRRLKYRIVVEKGYSEAHAEWLLNRLLQLVEYMHYGNALIAYTRQDGTFCLVTGHLRYYECVFRRKYDSTRIYSTVVYWDVELQGWRTFLAENLLEWRPIVG